MVIGKYNAEEKIVFFIPDKTEAMLLQFGASAAGAGGSMMTVGDVEIRNFSKSFNQRLVIGHTPDGVTNVVVRHKVVERRISRERIGNQRINPHLSPIS